MEEKRDKKKILTVLTVEDDAFLSSLVENNLLKAGYDVIATETGAEGLSHALTEHPDIILLDILLPDVGGLEVLRLLKNNDATKEIPVIIFSNFGGHDDVKNGLALGACEYLVKSAVLPSEVTEIIRQKLSDITE